MQEQQRADAEADEDAFGEVAEHDQQEGREQHDRIAARGPQQRRERILLGHVPGDHGKHAGERRQRDVARKRRGHQHEHQQEDRMQHAGDRAARAGADIGGGAGDVAGHADAAEKRRGDVGDALRHQLAVGAVAAPAHAVGDHRRQQAFDAAEQREGQRRRQHVGDLGPAKTPARAAAAATAGCRRSVCRWSRPAGRRAPRQTPQRRPR